jgi:integrase
MGYSEPREGKNGKIRWIAIYRNIRGEKRSAGTYKTEEAADAAWAKAENDIAARRITDPRRSKQTFERYVLDEWFPNHEIELTSRQNYTYWIDRYLLPTFGGMKMVEILPVDVREWVTEMKKVANPPTIKQCKSVLDAIFTTAFNQDRIIVLHPGRGVKTPVVASKPKKIVTVEQFEAIYRALPDDAMRLLVETDIESGLRWGELTELRVEDIDLSSGILTVSRSVVKLVAEFHPEGLQFYVKNYPKDGEWREVKLPPHLITKVAAYIKEHQLCSGDLLFEHQNPTEARRLKRPDVLHDPKTLGWTDKNAAGRRYRHGTLSAYTAGGCRCQHCRNTQADYRARRRANGLDSPRKVRTVTTDGHIGNNWFRRNVWTKALEVAELGFHVTPHGLRHAHASWLLAGGANIQVVKERLGHGSITTTAKYLHALPTAGDAALGAMAAIRGEDGFAASGSRSDAPSDGQVLLTKEQLAEYEEAKTKLAELKAMLAL